VSYKKGGIFLGIKKEGIISCHQFMGFISMTKKI